MLVVRKAKIEDLDAIIHIYNEAVLNTVATFDAEPKTKEEQIEWFSNHYSRYPILVADFRSRVIGWASLTKWSDRLAYSDTAECSIYLEKAYRGKGFGKTLLAALLHESNKSGFHTVCQNHRRQ